MEVLFNVGPYALEAVQEFHSFFEVDPLTSAAVSLVGAAVIGGAAFTHNYLKNKVEEEGDEGLRRKISFLMPSIDEGEIEGPPKENITTLPWGKIGAAGAVTYLALSEGLAEFAGVPRSVTAAVTATVATAAATTIATGVGSGAYSVVTKKMEEAQQDLDEALDMPKQSQAIYRKNFFAGAALCAIVSGMIFCFLAYYLSNDYYLFGLFGVAGGCGYFFAKRRTAHLANKPLEVQRMAHQIAGVGVRFKMTAEVSGLGKKKEIEIDPNRVRHILGIRVSKAMDRILKWF